MRCLLWISFLTTLGTIFFTATLDAKKLEPVAAPASSASQPLTVDHMRRKGDTAAIRCESDVHLDITCPSGIGGAVLRLHAENWPPRIILRLRYAPGKPFTRLEGINCDLYQAAQRQDSGAIVVELTLGKDAGPAGKISLEWVDMYR